MSIVTLLFVLRDIDDGESHCNDVPVLQQNAGAFHLVPMVDATVGVADEVSAGIVGKAAECPVVDAVDGGEMESFPIVPVVHCDVEEAAAEPYSRIFEVLRFADAQLRNGGVDRRPLHRVGSEDTGLTNPDAARAWDDLEGAVRTGHDADVGHPFMRAELIRYKCDLADVLPRAVERAGDENVAGPGFTDDDGITVIGENERGDVMSLALLIVRPAEAFIDIWPDEIIADGVDGLGAEPSVVAEGLVPAAGEDVVPAVRPVDDLPVPVVPQSHGGILEAILLIALTDASLTPGSRRERGEDRRRLEVVDEGLAGRSRVLP